MVIGENALNNMPQNIKETAFSNITRIAFSMTYCDNHLTHLAFLTTLDYNHLYP